MKTHDEPTRDDLTALRRDVLRQRLVRISWQRSEAHRQLIADQQRRREALAGLTGLKREIGEAWLDLLFEAEHEELAGLYDAEQALAERSPEETMQ